MKRQVIGAVICLTVIACSKPSGDIVGSWKMAGNSKVTGYEFHRDGSYVMKAVVEGIDVTYGGTYTIAGDELTLTPSGKMHASSSDPKNDLAVQMMNKSQAHTSGPQDETMTWKSPSEWIMTSKKTGATHKMDRLP